MAFSATADSSLTGVKLVVETTPGVTPASPAMKEMEVTSITLNNSRETGVSQSFRADRQVPGVTTTEINTAGDIGFELKVSDVMDDILAGTVQGEWVDDVLVNGVTRKSFTIEQVLGGIGGDNHQRFIGSEISALSLEISSGNFITGTASFISRDYAIGTTTVATTVIPASTNRFLNATDEGVTMKIGGVEVGLIQQMSINIENSLRPQRAIGSGGKLVGMGNGRFSCTGQMTVYFNGLSNPIWNAYKAKQAIEMELAFPDPEGNAYGLKLFKVEMMNAALNAGGLDQDVVLVVDYQAILGGEDSKTIEWTRTIAP